MINLSKKHVGTMPCMLDGKSKLNTCVKRSGDVDELSTFMCTFPVIVSVLEYLQTNGDAKSGVHLSALCDLTLFCN